MDDEYPRAQFLIDLKALGLTQAEFARRLGFDRHFVAQWGSARNPMPRWVRHLMRAWLANHDVRQRVRTVAREIIAMMESDG